MQFEGLICPVCSSKLSELDLNSILFSHYPPITTNGTHKLETLVSKNSPHFG